MRGAKGNGRSAKGKGHKAEDMRQREKSGTLSTWRIRGQGRAVESGDKDEDMKEERE